MTDEQQVRDALDSLIPDPPPTREWGAESRGIARRTRRRRVVTVGAAGVVMTLAVPLARSLATSDDHARSVDVTTQGTGPAACRQLDGRQGLGRSADSRVVDGATAARWLRGTGDQETASQVSGSRAVTVCVMDRDLRWSVAVARSGRPATVVHRGDYRSLVEVMTALDTLAQGGATTTAAPFRCPTPGAALDHGVASYLPSGATGALLCYDTSYLYSPRRILDSTELDQVLLAIDRAPVSYVAPNVACGGVAGFRSYSLVFRYPSGTRTVSMEECRGLALGVYTRNASVDLDQRVERLLLARGALFREPPTCPAPARDAPRGTGDLRHLVAARYCPPGTSGRPLTSAELSRLQRWGSSLEPASTGPDGSCRPPTAGWPQLALTDAWGNSFTMTVECRGRLFPATRMPDGSGHLTYPLGDQHVVQHLLRQLAQG